MFILRIEGHLLYYLCIHTYSTHSILTAVNGSNDTKTPGVLPCILMHLYVYVLEPFVLVLM